MTRSDFLNSRWKKYPKLPSGRKQIAFGRVVHIGHQNVCFSKNNQVLDLKWMELKPDTDEIMGESIDPRHIIPGDVIACNQNEEGLVESLFLLAPNRSGTFHKPDPHPKLWSEFLQKVSQYFLDQNFTEIRTPYLVPCPGVDHHIDYMEVTTSHTKRTWTLPTSPEIHLKKALCQGYDQIFEIKNCFRDDLEGPHHSPEFTMLEWYRAYEPLDKLVEDIENLVGQKVQKRFLRDVFQGELNFNLTPQTTLQELKSIAREYREDDTWNDVFFRIYMEKIEPKLGLDGPEVIFDFPAQQASLSQVSAEGWAQRFELYWNGVELANAFYEVNDPEQNKKIFAQENQYRRSSGKSLSPQDDDFFLNLEKGMPPTSGIALGLDRLFKQL